MDFRVHTAIVEYLRLIQDGLLWPFLTRRGGRNKLAAVNSLLTQMLRDASTLSDKRCESDEECQQGYECKDGTCYPIRPILDLVFAVSEPADQSHDAKEELEGGYTRIYEALATGLANDPNRLSDIRDLLMRAYAAALKLTGQGKRCVGSDECEENQECVDGVCVPVPFWLRFRPQGAPPMPPWAPDGPA